MAYRDHQSSFQRALGLGLVHEFGEVEGKVLSDVIFYHHHKKLSSKLLQTIVQTDSGAVLNALLSRKPAGATMQSLQDCVIGSALLADREAVIRWASEAANRCKKAGNHWPQTEPQWKWIAANADQYIVGVRELKKFLGQL